MLSGTLANGQFLSNRAAVLDAPLGKGHVVMFADPPVLALADAGHLLAWLQRDHELERPGRGKATERPNTTAPQQQ